MAKHKEEVFELIKLFFLLVSLVVATYFRGFGGSHVAWILLCGWSVSVAIFLISGGSFPREKKEQIGIMIVYPLIVVGLYVGNVFLVVCCSLLAELLYLMWTRSLWTRSGQIKNIPSGRIWYSGLYFKIMFFILIVCLDGPVWLSGAYSSSGVISFCFLFILTCFQYGLLPFHISALRFHDGSGYSFGRMVLCFNPVMASLLIKTDYLSIDMTKNIELSLLSAAFAGSFYQLIASFSERSPDRYIQYICNSLILFWLGASLYMSEGIFSGWALYYMGVVTAGSGACLCLFGLLKRYSARVMKAGGISRLVPGLSWWLLGCFFILSNLPLTPAFLGEDIILFELFRESPVIGAVSVVLIGLNAISLFRYFIMYFWGEPKQSLVELPLLFREKAAIAATFLAVLAGSFWIR